MLRYRGAAALIGLPLLCVPAKADPIFVTFSGTIFSGMTDDVVGTNPVKFSSNRFSETFTVNGTDGTAVLDLPKFDAYSTFFGTQYKGGGAYDLSDSSLAPFYFNQASNGSVKASLAGIFGSSTLDYDPNTGTGNIYETIVPLYGVFHADFTGDLYLDMAATSVTISSVPPVSPVPLPSSLPMFGAALLALGGSSYLLRSKALRAPSA